MSPLNPTTVSRESEASRLGEGHSAHIMRTQYPGLQNGLLDREGFDQHLIPGLWGTDAVMQEMDEVWAPTGETQRGKWQRLLLKNFVNSPQGAVLWQQEMI